LIDEPGNALRVAIFSVVRAFVDFDVDMDMLRELGDFTFTEWSTALQGERGKVVWTWDAIAYALSFLG
jgi:uncharacterized protein with NAD-binding domain and iron-sulfur cluster